MKVSNRIERVDGRDAEGVLMVIQAGAELYLIMAQSVARDEDGAGWNVEHANRICLSLARETENECSVVDLRYADEDVCASGPSDPSYRCGNLNDRSRVPTAEPRISAKHASATSPLASYSQVLFYLSVILFLLFSVTSNNRVSARASLPPSSSVVSSSLARFFVAFFALPSHKKVVRFVVRVRNFNLHSRVLFHKYSYFSTRSSNFNCQTSFHFQLQNQHSFSLYQRWFIILITILSSKFFFQNFLGREIFPSWTNQFTLISLEGNVQNHGQEKGPIFGKVVFYLCPRVFFTQDGCRLEPFVLIDYRQVMTFNPLTVVYFRLSFH